MANRKKEPGTSPGSLVLTGPKRASKIEMQIFRFSPSGLEENLAPSREEVMQRGAESVNLWFNIDGLHDTDLIQQIGSTYGIHPLNLEDILDTNSRPKFDDMEQYLFLSFKMLTLGSNGKRLQQEQISVVLGGTWLLSFQEVPGDSFNPVRERLRSGKGRMRKMGPDYLAYSLIDATVDYYFEVVEDIGSKIDAIDKQVLDSPTPTLLKQLHSLKNDLVKIRKAIWPLRDVINNLQRADSPLVRQETEVFLRDLHDHIIQLIETVETYRDLVSGLFDIYLSSQSNKTNDIIKVLTIITSIFVPLTFIVGVYGMNFQYLPELTWHFGYHGVWGVMIGIALGMVGYFRRRGWI
jgi:magnesium transporter